MTLTTRLSAFFLAVLAAVLATFSVMLYLVSERYLHRQVDDQLQSALGVLVAAVEVGEDGVEWEPHERQLLPDGEPGANAVYWRVADDRGHILESREDEASRAVLDEATADFAAANGIKDVVFKGGIWRLAGRSVRSVAPDPASSERAQSEGDTPKPTGLVVTAAISLAPTTVTLQRLAATAGGLSVALWLCAAATGRIVCRWALAPLTNMAQATLTIRPAELRQRLPAPTTGDELQKLGQAFNELLDRLQESFERQKQFTGNASHQLRTPLAIMLGQVEVALRRDRSAEEHRRVLVDVARQARHLRQLIEMLLFLARADAEAMLPHLETLELGEWLTAHMERWSAHARSADIHVEIKADHPFMTQAHPALLGQLLDNLLDNACKYSEPGTPITIRIEETAQACHLSIEDAGIGIPPEDLPHLFEPFHRPSQARRNGHEGVGLGLAVGQRIASAFGGRISASSQVGEGSRFTLELPASAAERAALEKSGSG